MDKLDDLVEEYLNDVHSRLTGVAESQRKELLLDLRTHIDQIRVEELAESEADLRNILDRLGSPETVATAARSEIGVPLDSAKDRPPRLKRMVIWSLVAVVVILIAVYVLFFSLVSADPQAMSVTTAPSSASVTTTQGSAGTGGPHG